MVGQNKNLTRLMLAILIIQLAASSFSLFPFEARADVSDPWALDGWQYRRAININGSSGAGYDYQMQIIVYRTSGVSYNNIIYLNGSCKSDFGDIRFTDKDGNLLPYYMVKNDSDSATFWFKGSTVDLSIDNYVYIYYGNDAASYDGNLDDVFVVAEDWKNASVIPDKWYVYTQSGSGISYSISTSEQYLQVSFSSAGSQTLKFRNNFTVPSFPNSWRFESLLDADQWSGAIKGWKDYRPSWGGTYENYLEAIIRFPSSFECDDLSGFNSGSAKKYVRYKFSCDGTWVYDSGYSGIITNPPYTFYSTVIFHNGYKAYYQGTSLKKNSSSTINTPSFIELYFYEYNDGYGTARWYPFMIRKYVYPEPKVSGFGDVEYPPNPIIKVDAEPEAAGSVNFKFDGSTYSTPREFEVESGSSHTLQALSSTITINATYHLGFSYWKKNGAWYSNDLTISTGSVTANANYTMVYENICFNVTATISGAAVSISGSTIYTPQLVYRGKGYTSFQVLTMQQSHNSTHKYVYVAAYVNGSLHSGSSTFSVYATGDTDVFLEYELVYDPPESPPPVITPTTEETTWYFRNDMHTVEEQLGYRLSETNSMVTVSFTQDVAANLSVTVGFRAWVYSRFGRQEITPAVVGLYTITSNGAMEVNSTWEFTGFNHEIIDAVEIRIYLRFGAGDWIQMLVAITDDDLNIRLPEGTWMIFYNLERQGNASYTNCTLYWGSSTFDTRVTLPIASASPWDIALVRLVEGNYAGWLLTPFTYHLGDLFYAIIVLFCCVTAYNDSGSLGYVLAILWLFGGAGSILSAMLPAITLNMAYILLAIATAFSLAKIILK